MGVTAPAPQSMTAQASAPIAVIDIGSHSVRMVVFDGPARAPPPRFNEKVLCGLGRKLAETGRLDEGGVALASETVRRFAALCRLMAIADVRMVATAAVRDASTGHAFVAELEKNTGFAVRILSGAEEAEYSAHGVVSGEPDADGLMGDLGGASLEVVALDQGAIGQTATLPLGPFRLTGLGGGNATRDHIDDALAGLAWLDGAKGRRLYLVGGAWRAIARIHMAQTDYPLRVIHDYRLSGNEAVEIARLLARQSRESLERIPGSSRRRIETLPLAALVLRRLIKACEPSQVVFSAYGLREGLVYAGLPPAIRREDPLLTACGDIAAREGRFAQQGEELADFIAPLFAKENLAERRIRQAAGLLSDLAWRIHPDHRGEQAFGQILYTPFAAIDHPGRVTLALAVLARYLGGIEHPVTLAMRGLIDEAMAERALRIGLALRLALTLAGGAPGALGGAALKLTDKRLGLELDGKLGSLLGETVQRRLAALGRAFGREVAVTAGR